MARQTKHLPDDDKLRATEQQLKATIQQLQASEQQLRAANQQLDASNQQLRATQEELRKLNYDLAERVKELNCLYGLSLLVERPDITLEEIFQGLMELIPPAWQYPEITAARITFENQQFKTNNFRKTAWLQSADIKVHGRKAGTIEVCYLRKRPLTDDGPFLREERNLLNVLAERLGHIIEREKAAEQIENLAKFPSENPYPVLRITRDGTIIHANDASAPVLQTWRCKKGQRIPDSCYERVEEAFRLGKVSTFEFECHDGRIFLVALAPVADADYVNAYAIDITERKKAEKTLRESEERFKQFFENEPEYCYMISPEGVILDVNNAALKALGYKKEELVGKPLKTIYTPESLTKVKRLFPKWKKTGRLRDEELIIISKTGEKRIVLLSADAVRNEDGEILHSVSIQRDITKRKKAEEALQATNQQLQASEQQLRAANQQLQASEQQLRAANQQLQANEQQLRAANEQLQASEQQLRAANQQLRASEQQLLAYQGQLKSLASQLTLTEEYERHLVATDLHATIGQNLVISKLQLDALRASAPSGGDLARTLEQVTNLLDETVEQTRTLVSDLSSPILYELGFETAVTDWLTEQIKQKHNIKTEFEDDRQPKPLDNDIRVLLFRNVRELLVNVVKHAHASKVKVSIGKVGSEIHVTVEDDGWGFDPKKVTATGTKKGGFGLFSIRERLEQLGGHFEIKSAPGYGCKVTMTASLKEEKH